MLFSCFSKFFRCVPRKLFEWTKFGTAGIFCSFLFHFIFFVQLLFFQFPEQYQQKFPRNYIALSMTSHDGDSGRGDSDPDAPGSDVIHDNGKNEHNILLLILQQKLRSLKNFKRKVVK